MASTREQIVASLAKGLDEVVEIEFNAEMLELTLEESGVDSLDLIEISMIMEGDLGVVTTQSDFNDVTSIGGVIDTFERLIAAQADGAGEEEE